MDDLSTWASRYRALFEQALQRYQRGCQPADLLTPADANFLKSIGGTAREFFDLVEDHAQGGDPDRETALLLTAARRDYFLRIDGGSTRSPLDSGTLPPKSAQLGGVRWLPRIIEKARRKLQGTMDDDLMYGCGGDRSFARRHQIHLADFLQLVRENWENEDAILAGLPKRDLE